MAVDVIMATQAWFARLHCHATAVIAAIMEQALILSLAMAAMAVDVILATQARFARTVFEHGISILTQNLRGCCKHCGSRSMEDLPGQHGIMQVRPTLMVEDVFCGHFPIACEVPCRVLFQIQKRALVTKAGQWYTLILAQKCVSAALR